MMTQKGLLKALAGTALAATMSAGLTAGAAAQTTSLRIQTHYAPETVSGKLAAQYVEDVQTMSGGDIQIEIRP